jgi:hypothetical protein
MDQAMIKWPRSKRWLPSAHSIGFNLEFAFLTAFVFALNVPYLLKTFVPINDSFGIYQDFHAFYRELYFHQQLASWVPYGTFGYDGSLIYLTVLTPMNYLFAFAGWLLKVQNVLHLFKYSIISEQLLFLLGVYLLGNQIYQKRSTVFLVCLAAIGGIAWYSQIPFNFRLYYLFPMVLSLVVRFFASHDPASLWWAGLVGVAWSIGGLYLPPIWVLTVVIIVVVLSVRNYEFWLKAIPRTRSSVVPFCLFIVAGAIYFYAVTRASGSLSINSPGRSEAGPIPLETFLVYGAPASLEDVFRSLVLGWPLGFPWTGPLDSTVYVGLLPLAFFVLALFREQGRVFWAVTSAAAGLVWLSLGGIFAVIVYHLPTMSQFRHIGYIYGLVGTLILIGAGFGLDKFEVGSRRAGIILLILQVVLFAILVDIYHLHRHIQIAIAYLRGTVAASPEGSSVANIIWPLLFAGRFGIYLCAFSLALIVARSTRFSLRSLIQLASVVSLFFDMLLFQYAVFLEAPVLPSSYHSSLESLYVDELVFLDQRGMAPETDRQKQAIALSTNPNQTWIYAQTYDFAQFDPCVPVLRGDWWSSGVKRLFEVRQNDDPVVLGMVGCESPKLRLVANVRIADDEDEAIRLVRNASGTEDVVILTPHDPTPRSYPLGGGLASETPGSVRVQTFSSNRLVAEVDVHATDGVWLVYADAHHPGWHAKVNGQAVPIAEANLAFKAIWLETGTNTVEFVFRDGIRPLLHYAVAAFGVAFGLTTSVILLRTLLIPVQKTEPG